MRKISLLLAAAMLLACLAGCSAQAPREVTVESVAAICGLGPVGLVDRFAGIVSARSETEIQKDEEKLIDEILVEEGESVTAGQVLFTYDMEQVALTLEKGELELEQLGNTLTSKQNEKTELEAEKAKAPASEQLSYTLEIQEADTAIRETEYNISLKEKEVEKLRESLDNLEVTSPVDGRVQSLNEEGAYDNYGNPLPFISIMETGTYRVKGYVNENNVYDLLEGTAVAVRSRTDSDRIWSGVISMIDWESATQDTGMSGMYAVAVEGEGEMTTSTKYPFYIELDDAEGLMLGQHVYIEPDYGQFEEADASLIALPEYYISDADSDAWVWAKDEDGKLEKRHLTLGNYDDMLGTYTVEEGLTAEDWIAFPDDTLEAGMLCVTYTVSEDEGIVEDDMAEAVVEEVG